MKVKMIPVAQAFESKTNPRGKDFEGSSFTELVNSIKEKGVLVPVIARPAGAKFEVVAGSRRLRAAAKAGLKEIPADVREMDDKEAQEVQIIENLQRADVHPLDEASAYLKLVQKIADIKAVAIKVGKSESYIHNRILLNQLCDEGKKAYQQSEINDGHAVEVAKLSAGGDQQKTLKHLKETTSWGRPYSIKDLHKWIEENIFDALSYQPWLKDKQAMAAVGPCKGCPANTNTLFGEAKDGACTMSGCHAKKMEKYLDWMKQQNPGMVLVATEYTSKPDVLKSWQWDKASKTAKGARLAMVVEGKGRGKTMHVLVKNEELPTAALTPEEKKKRDEKNRKEKEAETKRETTRLAKQKEKMDELLKKITWPLKEKHLDPIFEMVLRDMGDLEDIVKRRALVAKDDETALQDFFKSADARSKMQLIVDMLVSNCWDEDKFIKKFN